MKISIVIESAITDVEYPGREAARIVRNLCDTWVEDYSGRGVTAGTLRDYNGVKVGHWSIES